MKQMGINHIALSQPALMKRDANAPDSARLLHPAPAEEIFKDPLWVISPKNPPLLLSLVLEAGNRCLKCSSGGLQKDILCSAPLGSLFYSYGVCYFYRTVLRCQNVVQVRLQENV